MADWDADPENEQADDRILKEIPCEKRTNAEYLIDGYCREIHNSLSSFLPKSVIDIISYHYPKMNGHTFIWNIKNVNDKLNLSNNDDSVDSDVFNIGLSKNSSSDSMHAFK